MDGEADKLVSKLTGPTVEMAGNVAKEIPNIFINVIFTILSAYFFVADRDRIYSWADRVIPEFIKERWGWAKKLISNAIGGYFKAQFKIMCVIFAVLWLGLMILGVKYSILWAIFIAFLDMLPVFGTGSILLPWTLLEVLDGDYRQAVGLVILYLISLLLHQLLQPKMVGDSVGMDPLATLIVMFMGYRFYGVLGMIIAIPIGMILINLYRNGAFEQPMDEIRQLVKAFNQYRKS